MSSKRLRNQKHDEVRQQQIAPEVEKVATAAHQDQHEVEFRTVVDTIVSNVQKLLGPSTDTTAGIEDLAMFYRSEIVVGRRLGTGGFSDVSEVALICPHPHAENSLSFRQTLARECLISSFENGEGKYAIKHLRPELIRKSDKDFTMAAADLIVEGSMLASVRHPHILAIRGWAMAGAQAYSDGSHDGFFLIVDRIYETLSQRMGRWKVAKSSQHERWMECVRIATQLASALEYLHKRNIIFRDLKPDNIGFDANGDIKIFDFGLCRRLPNNGISDDNLFSMTGKVGTMVYMSPECALNLKYGVSSDVYSFSLVLFEMMNCGKKAFAGYDRGLYLEMVCRNGKRPQVDLSWPIMIIDLLERSWSANPDERPSMTEIKDRLHDVMLDMLQNEAGADESLFHTDLSCNLHTWHPMDRHTSTLEFHEHGVLPRFVLQD
jgi:serine/threonine protein kinase